MTRAIMLDMGNVLVKFDFGRAWAQMAPRLAEPVEVVRGRLRESGLVKRLDSGQMAQEEFVARFCELLGVEMGYEEFLEIWNQIFIEQIVPNQTLEALGRKYPLVLLSNTNPIHFAEIERRFDFLRYFGRRVLSHEAGTMKPAPEIYAQAVAAAGCEAGECFFADDMPEFVEGALRQGIDAVRFESAARLEEDLRARGVEW